MSFGSVELLRHNIHEADFLLRHAHVGDLRLKDDETLQRAVIRALEVMGEAAKKLDPAFRAQHPEIEWRALTGLRDRLIHGYFSVDLEIVEDIVRHKIPALRTGLSKLLDEIS